MTKLNNENANQLEEENLSEDVFLKAITSPYEVGTIEDTIFVLCKDSHTSIRELSTILGISSKILEQEYDSVMDRGHTACKLMLRRAQIKEALQGDSKQLVWMGKQVLGQEDKMKMDLPVNIIVQTGVPRSPVYVVNDQNSGIQLDSANGTKKVLTNE